MVSLTFVTPFISSSKVKMFTMQSEMSERVQNETEAKPLFTHEPFPRDQTVIFTQHLGWGKLQDKK